MTPLREMKSRFGSKEALIKEVLSLVERRKGESKDDFKESITKLSNKKLLRLHRVHSRIKEEFQNKTKLATEVLAQRRNGSTKDQDYLEKLVTFSGAKLLDMYEIHAPKS